MFQSTCIVPDCVIKLTVAPKLPNLEKVSKEWVLSYAYNNEDQKFRKIMAVKPAISARKIREEKVLRRPGIEPGSTAWKAAMLTTIPPTHSDHIRPFRGTKVFSLHFLSFLVLRISFRSSDYFLKMMIRALEIRDHDERHDDHDNHDEKSVDVFLVELRNERKYHFKLPESELVRAVSAIASEHNVKLITFRKG